MLKGFENTTRELTDYEVEELVPLLCMKLIAHKGKANAITSNELVKYCRANGITQVVTGARIRKVVEHIRHTYTIMGLCAFGNGYYIANTAEEVKVWATTLRGRRNALNASIQYADNCYKKMTGLKHPNQYTKGKMKPGQLPQQFLFQ